MHMHIMITLALLLVSMQIPVAWTSELSPRQGAWQLTQQSSLIDLNRADASTLRQGLKGIGAVKAQAIIAHREKYGPFASVDELLEVKGIGKSLLDRNRSLLTVR